jgi:uncharacterized protein YndB with AHSA1/START domain
MCMLFASACALGFALAGAAPAAVLDSGPGGFEVGSGVDIAAPPAKVWEALTHVGAWWDSRHSFSGDAKNLSLDLKPGGCFCETLADGGGARHMTVVMFQPGKGLVLEGALGPLQTTGAMGHMAWILHPSEGKTRLTVKYDVGGYVGGGADKWAKPVDTVLTAQLDRLKHYVETGKPD